MTTEFLWNLSWILSEFFYQKMTVESLWKFSFILIRILLASLSIPKFGWPENSSGIIWPQNSREICPGFDQNSSRNRWPWNHCENFHLFRSEFFLPALLSNNSDDLRILWIIVWPQNSCEISPGFDQNSSRNRWPQNYCESFHLFPSEFF